VFRRKKKDRISVETVPLPVLIRQVIYDSMLMPTEDIANALGLPPISDEVADMEEQASEERLERFASLIPFIDSHADMMSKIATSAYLLEESDEEAKIKVDEVADLTKLFRLVALSSSLSCVSTLFNLGLVEMVDYE
jgi:hypothetical protein